MTKRKASIIGVDVGGSKILLQSFDAKMKLVDQELVKTEVKKSEKGFKDQLLKLIKGHFSKDIKAIGVALPGIVDHKRGILVKAPHLPTKVNFPAKEILKKKFKCKVYVDNDINAFLVAEKRRPQLKHHKNIVALMVGTGLGGAIMVEGKLMYGAQGYAGEVGHMITDHDSPLKTLEQNTTGSFLSKITKELGVPAQKTNDPKIKRHLAKHLGIGLSNLNLIFNPDAFVIGGSIYHNYLAKNKAQLKKMIAASALDKKSPVILDAGKNTSVAKGIALMASEL